MLKIYCVCLLSLLMSCTDTFQENTCFQNFLTPINLDLNNPQLNNVLVPAGYVFINGGISQILLYNENGSSFKAFDTRCPNNDCATQMTFNGLTLKCPCDESEYSRLDGSLQRGNSACPAREYTVTKNGSAIRISD